MYSKEEQQFINLRAKFLAEIEELDRKMDEITARRILLENILSGRAETPVAEETKSTNELPPTIVGTEEIDKGKLERIVITLIKKNPGLKRADILSAYMLRDYDKAQVSQAIERLRRRRVIVSSSRGKASVIYLAEEKQ